MKNKINTRQPITASEGMIFTNGETYGTEIFLADGVEAESFYEITLAEYEAILASQASIVGIDNIAKEIRGDN